MGGWRRDDRMVRPDPGRVLESGVMAELPEQIPPDAGTTSRDWLDRWAAMWRREPFDDVYSPTYAAWLGRITSGLMFSRPPQVTPPDTADIPGRTLTELIEDVADRAAGSGVAYLRPVYTDTTGWTVQVLGSANVAGDWVHRTLVGGWVWTLTGDPGTPDDPTKQVGIVERWENDTVEYWAVRGQVDETSGRVKITDAWPAGSVPDPVTAQVPMFDVLTAPPTTGQQVRLYGVPWRWLDGTPAPIYAQNETLVSGLERLWDQEQVDAEMIRHRIALDASMINRSPVMASDGRTITGAGFSPDHNIIALQGREGVSQPIGDQLPFHVVTFPDSLTQRERIERRENALLEAVGINPQSVGRSVSGRSDSASAKRADQQMTLNTVQSPAARLAATLSAVLSDVARLNSEGAGAAPVDVTITPGPRPVPSESADTAQTMAATGAASVQTLVETMHPDWSPEMVDAEVGRVASEGGMILPVDGGG